MRDDPAPEVDEGSDPVVTEESLAGNAPVSAPFALTDGADETTALSVVGKSGGGLVAADGELEVSADCSSRSGGSESVVELFLSIAACYAFTCSCRVCTVAVSD